MFPVMLNLTGRPVVVVGGGPVGRRKAAAAHAAGAAVRVVDPHPDGRVPNAELVREAYRPDHLAGACLVFACGPPAVNARVVADARNLGVWVNSASDPAAGDVALPAVVRRGGLTLAVGTGGASPALAHRVRDKLAGDFDAAYADWVRLLDEVRHDVLATIPHATTRRELLAALADWPWLERIRAEGAAAVRDAMRAAVSAVGG